MSKEVDVHCRLDQRGDALLRDAIARLSLWARAYHRVLKIARTIADMALSPTLEVDHVAEAIGYRRRMDQS